MECPVCKLKLPEELPPFCPQCAWDLKNDLTLNAFLSPIPEEDFGDYRKKLDLAKQNWEYLENLKKQQGQSVLDGNRVQRQEKMSGNESHDTKNRLSPSHPHLSKDKAEVHADKEKAPNYGKAEHKYIKDLEPVLKRDPFETQEEFIKRLPEHPYYVGDIELLADSYDISTGKFPARFINMRVWAEDLFRLLNGVYLQLERDQARALYQKGRVWMVYAWLEVNGNQIVIKVLRTVTTLGEYVLKTGLGTRDGAYVLNEKGVVKDNSTGLQWVVGADRNTPLNQAISWVKNLKLDGDGWRMPTIDELKTLYNKGAGSRNMTSLLKTTGWWVWSSQTARSSSAWVFDFSNGSRFWYDRYDSYYGRAFAVRSRGDR